MVALVEQSLVRQYRHPTVSRATRCWRRCASSGVERPAASGDEGEPDTPREHYLRLSADLVQGRTILMDQDSLTRVVADDDNVRLARLVRRTRRNRRTTAAQLPSTGCGSVVGSTVKGCSGLNYGFRVVPTTGICRGGSSAQWPAILAILQGDNARGEASLAKAEALARELGDDLIGETLAYSAFLSYRGREFARAEELLDEAQHLLGGPADGASGIGPVLTLGGVVPFLTLGDLALAQGQVERAATHYVDAIARFGQRGVNGDGETCRPASLRSST